MAGLVVIRETSNVLAESKVDQLERLPVRRKHDIGGLDISEFVPTTAQITRKGHGKGKMRTMGENEEAEDFRGER